MADLQVTISATGAAELSTLFSSLEKVSTAAGKLAGSGKALEELRKLMVGLGNSGSSLGNLNKALNNVVSELQALPTRMATVLQNVPAQMARTGRAAGEALGQGIEQGAAASVGQARRRITTEVDQVQRAVEAAVRQQTLAATRAAEGAYSTIGAQPRLIRPTLLKLKEQNATLLSEAEKEEAKLQTALQLLEEKAARRDRERTQARWDSYVRGTGAIDGFKRGKAQERAAIVAEAAAETERLQAALLALDQRSIQQDQARSLRRWASWNRGTDAISRFKQAKAQERAELLAAAEQEAARLQAALQGMDLRSMQQDRERAQRRWDSYVRGAGAIEAFKRAEKLKTDAIIQAAQTEQARLEAAFDALARQAKRRVGTAMSSRDRGVYTDLRSGKVVQPPAAANEIDPAKADKGTNALLRQKAAIDAYIPTANTGHSAARGMASGFGLLWLTWGNLLPLLTTAAASNGFVAMAKSGSEVQHTLTMIAALSGASATEVSGLNAQMHNLAKNGIFGPRDIAEALKVLTQAGLSAKEASANLGATLNFSVAGMVPIQQAAETLVTVTTAFNMGAAGFSVAGDVIAKTAAISKTSVEGMSGAFKTASVLNAQYGVTLTDVGVGLAALANLGIEASAAGTALRNMYADLSGRSTKVSVILKEQGIQLRDLATGKFPDVIKVVRELNEVLSKKTPIGAQNLLQSLVGERGGKPLVEMLELFRKAPKDLSSGFSNALEEMQGEVRNAYGTAAQVAIAANTSVKNQYASLIASFQSDLVRVFEENEPRMLSAIASIKKSLMDGGELQAVLSGLLGFMSRIVQVVAENAKAFGAALIVWAASRSALALLSIVSAKLAMDTAAVATAQAAQATTTAAVGSAAAVAAGPVALLGRMLSGINIVIGVGAALWTAYQLAKSNAQNAKETAGQYSFDETLKGLKKENETLEKELVLLRQGKTEAEAQKALAIADVYQKAAEGMAQRRKGLEDELANMQPKKVGNAEGVLTPLMASQIKAKKEQIAIARKDEEEALQSLRDQQAILKANSQAKAELIELNSRRVPLGDPSGVDFELGKPGGGKPEQFANYTADLLRVQKDGHAKRMADLQQQSTFEKQLLDAKHRALLTSDADYQAESLAQTIADEQRRLTEVSNFRATAMADLDSKLASVKRDAGTTDLAEASKAEGDAYTKLSPHIQNLVGHYKRLADAREALDTQVDTDRSKITREAEQRRRMNEIDLAGRVRAEGKAYSDTARDMGVNLAAQQQRLQVEEQAAGLSEAVLAGQQARLAFEQEFAPQLAKRIEVLGQWEAAEKSLGKQLDLALETHEADSITITNLSTDYYAAKAAVERFRLELEKLRGVQSQGAGVAQLTAEVAQARKETKAMGDDLAEGLSKAIMGGSAGFKGLWRSLRDWLKDLFAKTILTPMMKPLTNGFVSGASNLLGLGGSGGGTSGGMLGDVGALASIGSSLGAFGTAAGYGFSALMGGTGMTALAGGASMAAAGSLASGLGMIAGVAGPIALAAFALASLDKKTTPHVGGYALSDSTGNVSDITAQQGGKQHAETQTAVAALSRSLSLSFNSVATTFGKDAGTSIRAVFESDDNDPSWGLFHILDKAGQKLQGSFDALGTLASDPADGLKEFSAKAAVAVRDALVAMDIPDWARKTLSDLGQAVDVDALTAAAQKIAEVQTAFKNFLETLKPYGPAFASVAALSINALDKLATVAGGLDQLSASLEGYYDKFFSAEEKRANTIAYLTAEFNKLGVMPTSMSAFRAEVEQAQGQLDTPEGQTKFAALLKLSGAFASLFEETADRLSSALESLASDRSSVQLDILAAQGDTAGAAQLQRYLDLTQLTDGLTESQKALVEASYDFNSALKEQLKALQHAAEVNRAVSDLEDTGRDLRVTLLKAQGRPEAASELQRMLDLKKLTEGMTAAEADRITAAYDANAAIQKQIDEQEAANRAAEEAAAAAKQLKDAWQSVTDSIFEEVRRIRGLTSSPANDLASRQSEFASLTAKARKGDQEAAKRLVEASSSLMEAAKNSAASSFDYRLQAASVSGSLQTTGTTLAKRFGLTVPKYDVGTNYVPFDQLAMLHEGEAVLPREYNPAAGGSAPKEDDFNAAAEEIRQLRDEQRRQTIAMTALQTRLLRLMERWEVDGMPETRVTA